MTSLVCRKPVLYFIPKCVPPNNGVCNILNWWGKWCHYRLQNVLIWVDELLELKFSKLSIAFSFLSNLKKITCGKAFGLPLPRLLDHASNHSSLILHRQIGKELLFLIASLFSQIHTLKTFLLDYWQLESKSGKCIGSNHW